MYLLLSRLYMYEPYDKILLKITPRTAHKCMKITPRTAHKCMKLTDRE